MQVTGWLDGYQRRHRWAGFPVAVIYKFFEDQGPYLAALITFYGFLSLFPLLLLLASVLGFVLQDNGDLEQRILDSALSQFPVIGDQLSDPVGLQGNRTAVVIGGLVALYGALGVAQALQNAMNVAWSVPRNRRPNPVKVRLRSLLLIGTAGIAVLATTILSALGGSAATSGALFTGWVAVLVTAAAVVVNAAIFVVAFRVSTAIKLSVRDVAARRHHRRRHLAVAATVRDGVRGQRRQGRQRHLRGVRRGAWPAGVDLPGSPRCRGERRDQRRAHQAPVSTRPAHPVHRQRRSHQRRPTRLYRRGDGPATQRVRVRRRHLRPRRTGGLGAEADRQRADDESTRNRTHRRRLTDRIHHPRPIRAGSSDHVLRIRFQRVSGKVEG